MILLNYQNNFVGNLNKLLASTFFCSIVHFLISNIKIFRSISSKSFNKIVLSAYKKNNIIELVRREKFRHKK